jgi:hypothetical protein
MSRKVTARKPSFVEARNETTGECIRGGDNGRPLSRIVLPSRGASEQSDISESQHSQNQN